MTEPATKSRATMALIELWRHDLLFPPAVLVVVFGIGAMLLAPPAWLGRVPTAVMDLTSNRRALLSEELEQTRRRIDESERSEAALTAERDRLQSGIEDAADRARAGAPGPGQRAGGAGRARPTRRREAAPRCSISNKRSPRPSARLPPSKPSAIRCRHARLRCPISARRSRRRSASATACRRRRPRCAANSSSGRRRLRRWARIGRRGRGLAAGAVAW